MKKVEKKLDVDYIGGQEPLTMAEEAAISQYITNKKKQTKRKLSTNKTKEKLEKQVLA